MYRGERSTGESAIPNIDAIPVATHDERARQGYVTMLRRAVMTDITKTLRETYDTTVEPAFEKATGHAPEDSVAVRKLMEPTNIYRFYSSLRYNAQEMTWASVQDEVERALPQLTAAAAEAAAKHPAGGSLKLNPALDIPKAVSALDIHLMPGCFHTEYMNDDVAVGAVYAHGTKVFSGGLKAGRPAGKGGVADSIAHYLHLKYPDFKPKRILDLGCTIGSNLLPYHRVFPEAELYGVDVGAPCLRYGHARAEAQGIPVHYSQENAEDMDFEDESFDLVVSSFFFHEIAVPSTRKILAETHRILKPGGLTVHMELPPSAAADAYYNFYLDWDAYHNNEPHYSAFRRQDPMELMTTAGFERDKCDILRIPDRGGVSDEDFAAFVRGEKEAPAHSNFASYYIFGAYK